MNSLLSRLFLENMMKMHSSCKTRTSVLWIEKTLHFLANSPSHSKWGRCWYDYLDGVRENALSLPVASKFIGDPALFLGPMAIVLDKYRGENLKGLLLLKYSYAFPLFLCLFDIDKVTQRFNIVLEPSWTGYCDGSILCYAHLSVPVYVQSLEPKDSHFLRAFSKSLIPVGIGANWWIDHRVFTPHATAKDTDLCVIASWAKFKKHKEIFDVVSRVKKNGKILKLLLLGYQIDMTMDDVYRLAKDAGIEQQIEMYEKISPTEVARQISRCKANLVWSKREGVNKAIIEGFFCNVPGILREGFNYGHKYGYINENTGIYSSPGTLTNDIVFMLENYEKFSPRQWVMNNMTSHHAKQKLSEIVYGGTCANESNPNVTKVNSLDGMSYFNTADRDKFSEEYQFLMSCAKYQ